MYNKVINILLSSDNECIPLYCKRHKKSKPGWNFVKNLDKCAYFGTIFGVMVADLETVFLLTDNEFKSQVSFLCKLY